MGAALVLQHMANRSESLSAMKARLPKYVLSKNKVSVGEHDPGTLLAALAARYREYDTNTIDGLKIDFEDAWVHLRKSNTEPIVRIYAEAPSQERASKLAARFIAEIETAVNDSSASSG